MNLRINTHRNGVWRVDVPPCNKHFQNPRHKCNKHSKFTIIQKMNNVSLTKQQKQSLLEHREDFWILLIKSLLKRSENILKPSIRHSWFHLVKLFQFLLSLILALFICSFLKFLLSSGRVLLIINYVRSSNIVTISTNICNKSKNQKRSLMKAL